MSDSLLLLTSDLAMPGLGRSLRQDRTRKQLQRRNLRRNLRKQVSGSGVFSRR